MVWIRNNLKPIEYKELHRDNNGNVLILEINFDNRYFQLAAIYGPNKDSPGFFEDLFERISLNLMPEFVVVGDWNVTQCHEKDNINYADVRNDRARKKLNEIIKELELIDPVIHYKIERPHTTYEEASRDTNRVVKLSRLDFFLVSPILKEYLNSYKKEVKPGSDHFPITLGLDFSRFGVGKPCWRFPDRYLLDDECNKRLKRTFRKVVLRYAINSFGQNMETEIEGPFYEDFLNNARSEHLYKRRFRVTMGEILENTASEIQCCMVAYAQEKRNENRNSIKKIERKLEKEEAKKQKYKARNQIINNNVERLRNELENKIAEIAKKDNVQKGVFNRIHGEQPFPGFGVISKAKANQKYIPALKVGGGEGDFEEMVITDKGVVENMMRSEYENLYRNIDDELEVDGIDNFLDDNLIPKIGREHKESLEKEITIEELTQVLKKTKTISSPGPTGLTYNMYKKHWEDLKYLVKEVADESFRLNTLPRGLRLGNISLIPKKKDKLFLKNWRPLTLLNSTYKLISGALSARLSKTLPSIINPDQQGFVKGRT